MPLPSGVFRTVKPNKTYWYFQKRRGQPDAGPIVKLPEFGTPEFWSEIARLTGEQRAPSNTFKNLIKDYRTRLEKKGLSAGTLKTYDSALNPIREMWGELDPAETTVAGIMEMQDSFSDRPSMGNMVLIQLRALMKLAVQKGWRKDNPAREIDKFEEDPDGAQPLSAEAWAALTSDAAPDDLKRFAILGRATGQRISDIIRMTPAGREQEGLNCRIKKLGDKQHWCILSQAEAETIDGWKQFKGAAYVMQDSGRRHNTNSMRDVWNDFAATEAGSALKGFTPHDLRATKVCDERISGKSHQRIAAIVGMSVEMVMKYSRHIDQKAAARGTGTERE
ncbi:tyrosine-type recombinase/integrase [Bosea minatitlanensis]|uniref:Tyrosine-type recombinase/integrase n=1 Tax=Bosea minatitlanensis TaxID=128782 RepID=A0ABW0F0Q0_9HYPH|nr:hypothetical protein [Bosea minatitlanensis]MCT4493004.1 hypothetical protein [Bosea minatitlanensis]